MTSIIILIPLIHPTKSIAAIVKQNVRVVLKISNKITKPGRAESVSTNVGSTFIAIFIVTRPIQYE